MSKKSIKILSAILTLVVVVMAFATPAFAAKVGEIDVNPTTTGKGAEKASKLANNIVGIIQVGGTIIAVGVLMVLGVKYMMGSAEEKASYKKTMIPYLVGAVILFAASNLAGFIATYATELFS